MIGTDPFEILGFQLYEDIGEGGYARVRLGYNHKTQTTAAIKILSKGIKGKLVDLKSLRKELKIHSAIQHKNIVKLYGSSEDENNVYLVLEYAAGKYYRHCTVVADLTENMS
jgi:maternal embryonic leucine zipper kinase